MMNQIFSYCDRLPKLWFGIKESVPDSKEYNREIETVNSAAQIEAYLQEDDDRPVSGMTLFLYGDED